MSDTSRIVIGLEVHIQLATASKAFCGCRNAYGEPPNTLCCPICLGYPGALPMFNAQALVLASRLATALGCKIADLSVFARKNYFYPDLPKGFQISQYDQPLSADGTLVFEDEDGTEMVCGIERVHLEEDVAKSTHADDGSGSLLDFNRAGVPLVEVVGRPELVSARAARRYLEELQRLVRSTGASECDMEKGSLRVDVNVSLRNPDGSFGTKIEVKNLNSFKSVEKALEHEVKRQGALLGQGTRLVRETRLWDEKAGVTVLMRVKEGADDYRYFPEPDLPAIRIDDAFRAEVRAGMVAGPWRGHDELPLVRERWCRARGIPPDDARIYAADPLFYATLREGWEIRPSVDISTQLVQYIRPLYNARLAESGEAVLPSPDLLAEFAEGVAAKRIMGGTTASTSFWRAWYEQPAATLAELVGRLGLAMEAVDEGKLDEIITAAILENPKAVEQVLGGKEGAVGPIMGLVMKALGGKADAAALRERILLRIREG